MKRTSGMKHNRLWFRFALAAFFALAPILLSAQGVLLAKGREGKSVDLSVAITGAGLKSGALSAGFSSDGFLDLGTAFTVSGSSNAGAADIDISLNGRLYVLKQDALVPITFLISGAYGKTMTMDDGLAALGLSKSGTEVALGAEVIRTYNIFSGFDIILGINGTFVSSSFITEPMAGTSMTGYPTMDSSMNFMYGGMAGVAYKVNESLTVAGTVRVTLDKLGEIQIAPQFSLVVLN
jgi:hypothetical protein